MKQTVRFNVFETNSSSTHSLVTGTEEIKKYTFDGDELVLSGGEYGWGIEDLTTWQEKANYLAVEAFIDTYKKHMLVAALRMMFPDITIRFIQEADDFCYIDHQSSDVVWSDLHNADDVYKLLFSNAVIHLDNDNH